MSEAFISLNCSFCQFKNSVNRSRMEDAICGICQNKLRANFYQILSVNQDASNELIKNAYRKLALTWHPDRNPNKKFSENVFKSITEAFVVLSNADKRRSYDFNLKNQSEGNSYNHFYSSDEAHQVFYNEMMDLALELAFQNHSSSRIQAELELRGCPIHLAKAIAEKYVHHRERATQNKEYKKDRLAAVMDTEVHPGTLIGMLLILFIVVAPIVIRATNH